jgi:uncharacterized protein YjeT (DUF2065 family)
MPRYFGLRIFPMGGFGMAVSLFGILLVFFSFSGRNQLSTAPGNPSADLRGIGLILVVVGLVFAWL